MSNVLLVRSSIFGWESKSLRLANEFLSRYPHASLVERVLTPSTIPHLTAETYLAMGKPDSELTDKEKGACHLVGRAHCGGERRRRDRARRAHVQSVDPVDAEGLNRSRRPTR
jgi:hypothetical protein